MPVPATVWLTPKEASDYTRVHIITLRRAVARGELTAFHINGGRSVRYRKNDLDAWLSASSEGKQP